MEIYVKNYIFHVIVFFWFSIASMLYACFYSIPFLPGTFVSYFLASVLRGRRYKNVRRPIDRRRYISLPDEEDKQNNESDEKQRTDYDADDECRQLCTDAAPTTVGHRSIFGGPSPIQSMNGSNPFPTFFHYRIIVRAVYLACCKPTLVCLF